MNSNESSSLPWIVPAATGLSDASYDPGQRDGAWFRPKDNLGWLGKLILMLVVSVPLIMMISRVLAYPDVAAPAIPGIEWLQGLGSTLNQYASLNWMPPQHRSIASYLLMLPTGALLIAFARLTLGFRVLGLRSILISIGFQEIGVLSSLTLMFLVIAIIVAIRPAMTHIRLPLYARITVVLCVCSIVMVGALMMGPVLKSEAVWSLAFFPVIIAAMIAESVAKTIASDNAVTAAWRVFWTIAVAGVLAAIGQTGFMVSLLLMFPEVMILQMAGIILIAEYFDLRLFEETPQKIEQLLEDRLQGSGGPIQKIAVVVDPRDPSPIGELEEDPPGKSRRSVKHVVEALRAGGAQVKVLDGDINLLRKLDMFMNIRTEKPGGLVINLVGDVPGTGMAAQVPAMLDMAGVPYSGPTAEAHSQLSDRWRLLAGLQGAGVPVPRFCRANKLAEHGLEFPLRVHPPRELMMRAQVTKSEASLEDYLEGMSAEFIEKAMLEEIPQGRDIRVALIGNEPVCCLPPLEKIPRRSRRICPAELEEDVAHWIHQTAIDAFNAAGCRDYARVDFRVTPEGTIVVVGIHVHDILARNGSVAQAARAAGLEFPTLINSIARVAWARQESMNQTGG